MLLVRNRASSRCAAASTTVESGFAFFQEGVDGFGVILGLMRQRLVGRGQLQHIGKTALLAFAVWQLLTLGIPTLYALV